MERHGSDERYRYSIRDSWLRWSPQYLAVRNRHMTAYTIHPIDETLLAQLWENLWDRGHVELTRLGHTVASGYREFLKFGERSIDSGIVCADGKPVAVGGICPDGDGTYFTFFQATGSFREHAKKVTKVLRKQINSCNEPVFIYSVLVHPDTERWFKTLGFERDGWCGRTYVGHPLYRFRRINHVR